MFGPIKYGGKLFITDGGQIVLAWVNLSGDCSIRRIND